MTEKLYLKDMYPKEFTAKVVSLQGNKVILDRTCFFIQGSGQSGDSGELNGIRVIETQKGGVHLLAKTPNFKVGDEVTGKIDWNKRYKTMRLHSASHIVEHFVYNLMGKVSPLKTNVNDKKDFTDYAMRLPTKEEQEQIAQLSKEYIRKNVEIEIRVDDKGIYHWTAGEVKTMCTGTHTHTTSEIGEIMVEFEGKEQGMTRVVTRLKE